MKRSLPLIFLLLALPAAAAETKHPIDIWFAQAMSKTDGVTANIREVDAEANVRWDADLNAVYKRLLSRLPLEERKQLVTAQRKWVAWRNAELKLQVALLADDTGTLTAIMLDSEGFGMIRQRALDLESYDHLLDHPP